MGKPELGFVRMREIGELRRPLGLVVAVILEHVARAGSPELTLPSARAPP